MLPRFTRATGGALLVLAGGVAALPAQDHASSRSPLWFDLEGGPHAIGFAAEFIDYELRDGGGVRPVRIFMWYPAGSSGGTTMTFGDYHEAVSPPEEFADYHARLLARDRGSMPGQFAADDREPLLDALLSTEVAASLDVAPAEGRFPLVIHLLGLDDHQLESTVMWEFLASHGYVVAVVPQFGVDLERMDVPYDSIGARLQRLDARVTHETMVAKSFVDGDRFAVVGHSFGGLVGVLLAAEEPAPAAVALLDGSPNMPRGRDLLRGMEEWDPLTVRTPILNLYTAGSGARDLAILRGMRSATRHHAVFPRASHFDFQNWALFAPLVGVDDPRGTRLRTAVEGRDTFLGTIEITWAFLEHYLRGSDSTLAIVEGRVETRPGIGDLARFFTDAPGR